MEQLWDRSVCASHLEQSSWPRVQPQGRTPGKTTFPEGCPPPRSPRAAKGGRGAPCTAACALKGPQGLSAALENPRRARAGPSAAVHCRGSAPPAENGQDPRYERCQPGESHLLPAKSLQRTPGPGPAGKRTGEAFSLGRRQRQTASPSLARSCRLLPAPGSPRRRPGRYRGRATARPGPPRPGAAERATPRLTATTARPRV